MINKIVIMLPKRRWDICAECSPKFTVAASAYLNKYQINLHIIPNSSRPTYTRDHLTFAEHYLKCLQTDRSVHCPRDEC